MIEQIINLRVCVFEVSVDLLYHCQPSKINHANLYDSLLF